MGMEGFNPLPPEEEIPQPEKRKTSVEVSESLKRSGLDFTTALNLMGGRLSKIDKETEAVSPGTPGKFRAASRSLEDSFQSGSLDLNDAGNSFNRLGASFDDLSLISDKDLAKVEDDHRKSLASAIQDSTDSARALRMDESIVDLHTHINGMIDKADGAAHRWRRGVRA